MRNLYVEYRNGDRSSAKSSELPWHLFVLCLSICNWDPTEAAEAAYPFTFYIFYWSALWDLVGLTQARFGAGTMPSLNWKWHIFWLTRSFSWRLVFIVHWAKLLRAIVLFNCICILRRRQACFEPHLHRDGVQTAAVSYIHGPSFSCVFIAFCLLIFVFETHHVLQKS